jgi:hypothetical protein
MSGAQLMSEANALAEASAVGTQRHTLEEIYNAWAKLDTDLY